MVKPTIQLDSVVAPDQPIIYSVLTVALETQGTTMGHKWPP